jgi:hypothetical protein
MTRRHDGRQEDNSQEGLVEACSGMKISLVASKEPSTDIYPNRDASKKV